jgi:6-phosphogluconolactonase (cycloisomerase 2 family)
MRTRFTWMMAVLALVSIGFVVACSTKYSSSSNGLVVVPIRDSPVMETFSIDLSNGHASQINNVDGPPIAGLPSSVILDPAGAFAYVLISQNPGIANTLTGIEAFQVGSDGKLAAGTTTSLNGAVFMSPTAGCESVPVTPVAMAMDSAGKFLFVANSATSDGIGNSVPGSVSVFAISGGSLTEVNPVSCTDATILGSPFPLTLQPGGTTPSASALAVTPTVFPAQFAPCSVVGPPTTENLYVTDSVNNQLFNFTIDSSGNLSLVLTGTNPILTGTLPSGVTVDPCNRFVYVANFQTNNVSAYTICAKPSATCPLADYSLQSVPGSPYSTGDGPGPITVDAYAGFLYVVATGASEVSEFRIGSATGALTSIGTAATNVGANSIAIRSDDSFLFVANSTSANVSQFAITPASGTLTLQTAITTLNLPSGVAVK